MLIVDGLDWGRTFFGAPRITDPLSQIVYGVHPYFSNYLSETQGKDVSFGYLAQSHSVLATEWGMLVKPDQCPDYVARQYAATLLTYLQNKRIGLIAWALDYPGSIFRNLVNTPTDFRDGNCKLSNAFGPGNLILDYFHVNEK